MQGITKLLVENKEIILLISSMFTACGTVGAVIVVLVMEYKDSRPKLKVFAEFKDIVPGTKHPLWILCTNISKQSVICNGFAFKPNRFQRGIYQIMPFPNVKFKVKSQFNSSKVLKFSESIDSQFDSSFFADDKFNKLISKHRWIAKIQLKFLWRIIAITNVKKFSGKLSNNVINAILSAKFSYRE